MLRWRVVICFGALLAQGCFPDWPEHLLLPDAAPTDLGADRSVDQRPEVLSPCHGLTCPGGCNTSEGRCYRLDPSNFDISTSFDQLAANVAAAGQQLKINTDTGEVQLNTTVLRAAGKQGQVDKGIYWGVVKPATGYPELSVFGFKELSVTSGGSAVVQGTRTLAIYTAGSVTIDGELGAMAKGQAPGPGGFKGGGLGGDGASCFGGAGRGGSMSGLYESGGGGGGRGGGGGNGGDATGGSPTGGAGGKAAGNADLVPLFGGCGGGGGGGISGGVGGSGGGGLQISANGPLIVGTHGVINVSGSGGKGSLLGAGGGGGGSGGAILLEGLSVKVQGLLAANGGGGGAGGGAPGPGGQDGQASTKNALGGAAASGNSGAGGDGGALGPEDGSAGESDGFNAGGGGGAAGRTRINAPVHSLDADASSPAPSISDTIKLW